MNCYLSKIESCHYLTQGVILAKNSKSVENNKTLKRPTFV